MNQRMLKGRAEQSVVDCEQRAASCRLRIAAAACAISVIIERGIGGRLDQHQAQIVRLLNRLGQRLRIAGRHAARLETERLDHLVDQVLRAAVERLRIDERAAALEEREHHGEDRGHPGIENRGRVGAALERHQLLLENLGVGMIEPRVDQIGTIVAERPDFSEHDSERALRRLRTRKDERRAAIDWRPRRADRQRRDRSRGSAPRSPAARDTKSSASALLAAAVSDRWVRVSDPKMHSVADQLAHLF